MANPRIRFASLVAQGRAIKRQGRAVARLLEKASAEGDVLRQFVDQLGAVGQPVVMARHPGSPTELGALQLHDERLRDQLSGICILAMGFFSTVQKYQPTGRT